MRAVAALSQLRTVTAAALIIGFVASCDGDGDSKPTNTFASAKPSLSEQSPAGIYTGSFQSTATALIETRFATGVVSGTSEIHLMMQPASRSSQYGGIVSVDGAELTGTLTEYLGSNARWFGINGVRSIELDGIVSEGEGLYGDYTGDDKGVFQLDYDARYERGSSLSQTVGVWTFDMASSGGTIYSITLDIGPLGELFGADSNGCVLAGGVEIIDSRFNAYSISVTASSCSLMDGDYSGLAFRDDLDGGNTLYVFFTNELYAFSTRLSR